MITKFIILLCLLTVIGGFSISGYAQQINTTSDNLQAKQWIMVTSWDGDKPHHWTQSKYGKDKVKLYINNDHIGNEEYYLSDSIVTIFDSTKVGNTLDGRYIVSRIFRDKEDKRPKPITVLEIVELDESKLMLRNIKRPTILLEYKAK